MKTSLIITTYNWPKALDLVLLSVRQQTILPDEVIIADDGSKPDTRALLEAISKDFPCPIRHVWQEDTGFRLARIRNLAIAASTGEYLIIVDGDMVLHKNFIQDHQYAARPNFYVQGSRVYITPECSENLISTQSINLKFFSPGIENRGHTLRIPWLASLWRITSAGQKRRGVRGCNQAWWRSDVIKLNGFDERMTSWGVEDTEMVARAFHCGMQRQDLRFSGLAFHLWHQERHVDGISVNQKYLDDTNVRKLTWAENGVDLHLHDFNNKPCLDLRGGDGK